MDMYAIVLLLLSLLLLILFAIGLAKIVKAEKVIKSSGMTKEQELNKCGVNSSELQAVKLALGTGIAIAGVIILIAVSYLANHHKDTILGMVGLKRN